jgi:hypothetical protein
MIAGDIDLTENLDFYHDKPDTKDLSSSGKPIPWRRKSDDLTWRTWSVTATSSSWDTVISYGDSARDNFIYDLISSHIYNHTSTTSCTTAINYYMNAEYNTWYPIDFNSSTTNINHATILTTSTGGHSAKAMLPFKGRIKRNRIEDRSAFTYCANCGEKMIHKWSNKFVLCKRCAMMREENTQSERTKKTLKKSRTTYLMELAHLKQQRSIRACMGRSFSSLFRRLPVPWDNDEDEIEIRGTTLSSLPWLDTLSSRIYGDYRDELRHGEKDYSEYLTNMGWLHIH